MLSSLEKTLYQHEAENIGINKFLSKPVKLIELNNILEAIFSKTFNGEAKDAVPMIETVQKTTKVLVVEDEPVVRQMVVDLLRELGYATLQAEDARGALPLLESGRPIDLLLSDVGLPGMNGRQLAEIARQRRPGLKVLFATGYAEGAHLDGYLDPGMTLITKPFNLDALAARVGETLALNPTALDPLDADS